MIATINYTEQLYAVRKFAIAKHGTQKYGSYPYEIHLGNVVGVLMHFGVLPNSEANFNLLASAWLHDVLEDTAVTQDELEVEFGTAITQIVYCVTDEEGTNRRERKEKTYKKLVLNQNAIIVKLADRIANTEFCLIQDSPDKYNMYKKEQPKFEEVLGPAIQTQLGNNLLSYLKGCFKDR